MAKIVKIWIGNAYDGNSADAEQLGTFMYPVKERQFYFIVTRYESKIRVTHRLSGLWICTLDKDVTSAARVDYVASGQAAVRSVIDAKGVDRLYDVLTSAEKKGYGLLDGKPA